MPRNSAFETRIVIVAWAKSARAFYLCVLLIGRGVNRQAQAVARAREIGLL